MIIEDYDKGLLCRELIEKAIGLAAQHNVPVAVDPKQKHFDMYRNVDVFKPNYAELQAYLGKNYSDKDGFLAAASELRQDINCKHLVVTWGSKGMYVFSEDAQPQHFPSFAREVFDVSGAGDTVISALCLAYLKEQDVFTAALVANHAAAVVVAKHGTASVNTLEIMDSFYEQSNRA
jgi:D-beta-D-heptose 7-phosphate kinase/D-beta-D-heptose 1-phosphate adenosyltransferase